MHFKSTNRKKENFLNNKIKVKKKTVNKELDEFHYK